MDKEPAPFVITRGCSEESNDRIPDRRAAVHIIAVYLLLHRACKGLLALGDDRVSCVDRSLVVDDL